MGLWMCIIGLHLLLSIRVEAHLLKQAVKLLQRIEVQRDPTLTLLPAELQSDLGSKMKRQPLLQIDDVRRWLDSIGSR